MMKYRVPVWFEVEAVNKDAAATKINSTMVNLQLVDMIDQFIVDDEMIEVVNGKDYSNPVYDI